MKRVLILLLPLGRCPPLLFLRFLVLFLRWAPLSQAEAVRISCCQPYLAPLLIYFLCRVELF